MRAWVRQWQRRMAVVLAGVLVVELIVLARCERGRRTDERNAAARRDAEIDQAWAAVPDARPPDASTAITAIDPVMTAGTALRDDDGASFFGGVDRQARIAAERAALDAVWQRCNVHERWHAGIDMTATFLRAAKREGKSVSVAVTRVLPVPLDDH